MKTLVVVLCMLLSGEKGCFQLDIVLLVDFSSSVQGQEGYIFKAISDFSDSFEIDDNDVRIGVVAFNSTAFVACPITGQRKKIDDFIMENSLFCMGTTAMDQGLKTSYEQFGIEYEGLADRSGAKKIIVVVSDGEVDDPIKTIAIAQDIQNQGVDIWGVLILNESAKPAYLKAISSPGKYVETDYERLGVELNQLNFCL